MEIKIIHTSDLHGHFNPEKMEKIKNLKKDLLFDSGDAIKSGNISFNVFGESAHVLMNQAGYSAGCAGNREYHFSKYGMKVKNMLANFPVLSLNLYSKNGEYFTKPFVEFNVHDFKILVLGLSNINISSTMKVAKIAHQYQTDPIDSAKDFLDNIKKEDYDLIIALTHIGLKSDRKLAEKISDIDIILGGHSHNICHEIINKTHIIHSGCFGEICSDIKVNTNTKEILVTKIKI